MGIIEEVEIAKISFSNFTFREAGLENIDELAISIKQHGLLSPIVIRTKDNGFEIVTGILRYLACKKLGYRKIMAHIIEINEKEAFEISLIENLQRKSLSPFEEAKAFKAYVTDFGWGGISDLSSKISKSVSYVYKRLSMLELPQEILNDYKRSLLNNSTMEELVFVKDRNRQIQIAKQSIEKKMTVKEIRGLIKKDNEIVYDYERNESDLPSQDNIVDLELKAQRSFDKAITTLKIGMSKMASIIENNEDNWLVYEILMQHKNMLNNQIDILIKEKKKLYNNSNYL
jgi:ParB family chromosome partitioning protein